MPGIADDNLVWIDLEMTGLCPDRDSILEIACVVTDRELNVLAIGPEFAIHHDEARLDAMDDWNRNQHRKSGLWQRVLESDIDHACAEAETVAFLAQWVPAGKSPMCGNSICQDRRFLYRQMPALEKFFHYRKRVFQGIRTHRAVGCAGFDCGVAVLPSAHDGTCGQNRVVRVSASRWLARQVETRSTTGSLRSTHPLPWVARLQRRECARHYASA